MTTLTHRMLFRRAALPPAHRAKARVNTGPLAPAPASGECSEIKSSSGDISVLVPGQAPFSCWVPLPIWAVFLALACLFVVGDMFRPRLRREDGTVPTRDQAGRSESVGDQRGELQRDLAILRPGSLPGCQPQAGKVGLHPKGTGKE